MAKNQEGVKLLPLIRRPKEVLTLKSFHLTWIIHLDSESTHPLPATSATTEITPSLVSVSQSHPHITLPISLRRFLLFVFVKMQSSLEVRCEQSARRVRDLFNGLQIITDFCSPPNQHFVTISSANFIKTHTKPPFRQSPCVFASPSVASTHAPVLSSSTRKPSGTTTDRIGTACSSRVFSTHGRGQCTG